ncbi:MAG: hypothetical protein A2W85_13865 [Bacteroidetes bacterium GWF2_41_31]|nr:MAG: hypothetical protein A2W85_13865 [Bacteroidetes bacterium GWF2_41_31]
MKRWSKCRINENASECYYPNGTGELVKSPIATFFPTPEIKTGAEHHQKVPCGLCLGGTNGHLAVSRLPDYNRVLYSLSFILF